MSGKHTRLRLPLPLVGLSAVFYGLKVLTLADGNMTTALALALNIEFLPALGAILLSVAPTVILPLALYGTYLVHKSYTGDVESYVAFALMFMVSAAALFYSSIIPVVACFSLWLSHRTYLLGTKKKWKINVSWMRFRFQNAQPVVMALISTSILSTPVWLPRESAMIEGSPHAIAVVRELDNDVLYLDMDSKQLLRTEAASLVGRKFCGAGPSETMLAMTTRLIDGPIYPACPKTK